MIMFKVLVNIVINILIILQIGKRYRPMLVTELPTLRDLSDDPSIASRTRSQAKNIIKMMTKPRRMKPTVPKLKTKFKF